MSPLALHARLRCCKLLVRRLAALGASLACCAAVLRGKRVEKAAALLRSTSDGGDQRLRRKSATPVSKTLAGGLPIAGCALAHALGWHPSCLRRLRRRSCSATRRASDRARRKRTGTAPVELQRVGWRGLARHLLGPLFEFLAALQLACHERRLSALCCTCAAYHAPLSTA